MHFEKLVRKEAVGAGVWIINPEVGKTKLFSYKLTFECTNNVVEYEALLLGLKVLKKPWAKMIVFYADIEIVIMKFKGDYQMKHTQMRADQNVFVDCLQKYFEYKISVSPRRENVVSDDFATSAFDFEIYSSIRGKYKVEVKYRPIFLDNMRYWQVFENDKQFKIFF